MPSNVAHSGGKSNPMNSASIKRKAAAPKDQGLTINDWGRDFRNQVGSTGRRQNFLWLGLGSGRATSFWLLKHLVTSRPRLERLKDAVHLPHRLGESKG
jgi:hypothetical protein